MADTSKPLNSLGRSRQIDACCDAFEAAWKSGQRPNLATQLQSTPSGEQIDWLRELIPIDLFHRRKRGEQPRVEEYLAQFPLLNAPWLEAVFAEQHKFPVMTVNAGYQATIAPTGPAGLAQPKQSESGSDVIMVPGYELIGELGRGAMGVVYKARQLGLGRTVALKMIRSRGDASPEELARFHSEGAAIAQLAHPNIVQIYDLGEHDGRPYFSLEYIDGGTLAQQIAGVPQPPREAARTIETLARAIHQAHQAGIVHRDLKPANVLVTRHGVPKITDFGLAKQTQADHSATATGMLLGTPQYMAPEQAAGNSALVGSPADIYALGVMLYEMLTGRPPFQAANLADLLQAINTQDPARPSLLKHDTPKDLETICLKCLQKNPSTRYETAAALAEDLLRFLEERPIRARPISRGERFKLWCRRNPQVAIPSGAFVALLIVVSIGSLIAAISFLRMSNRANQSEREAVRAKKDAELAAQNAKLGLARSLINEARMLRRSQRVGQQKLALDSLAEANRIFRELEARNYSIDAAEWDDLRNEAASAWLVPDVITTQRWPRESLNQYEVATDLANRRYVAFAPSERHAVLRRMGTGEPLEKIAAPPGSTFTEGLFSEDGRRLQLHSVPENKVSFWDVQGPPRLLHSISTPPHWRTLSPDGKVYVSANADNHTRVIRVENGELLAETELGIPTFGFPLHPRQPWVALQAADNLILFDYEQQRPLWRRPITIGFTNSSWSRDGRYLAVTGPTALQTYSAENGEPLFQPIGFDSAGVFPIPVSQSGLVGASDWSGAFRLFQAQTGQLQLTTSAKYFNWPQALGESGRLTLGYADADYVSLEVRGSRLLEFGPHGTDYVALSHSGRLLAVYCEPGGGCLFDIPSGTKLATLPQEWGELPLGFEPDDRALLIYGKGALQRIPLEWTTDQPPRLKFGPAREMLSSNTRDVWKMSDRGTVIVVPDFGRGGDIYHFADDEPVPKLLHTKPQNDVRHAAVSPDGKWAVFGSHVLGQVAVYSAADATLIKELSPAGGFSFFSPDGEWLAVGKFAGGGELFKVKNWRSRGNLPGQRATFTKDGKLLAVDSGMSGIALIETQTLRRVTTLEIQSQVRVRPLTFTPDGSGLIACTLDDRRMLYFDLAGLRADLQQLQLDWNFSQITLPPRAGKLASDEPPTVEIIRETPAVP